MATGSSLEKATFGVEYMNTTKLRPTSRLQLDELRASLLNVVEFCPESVCHAGECPLFAVREMNARERAQWINALTGDELSFLAVYHHIYWNLKMSEEPEVGLGCPGFNSAITSRADQPAIVGRLCPPPNQSR
jgi:hypothetical protein